MFGITNVGSKILQSTQSRIPSMDGPTTSAVAIPHGVKSNDKNLFPAEIASNNHFCLNKKGTNWHWHWQFKCMNNFPGKNLAHRRKTSRQWPHRSQCHDRQKYSDVSGLPTATKTHYFSFSFFLSCSVLKNIYCKYVLTN